MGERGFTEMYMVRTNIPFSASAFLSCVLGVADTIRRARDWKKTCGGCRLHAVKKCQICGKRATMFLTQIVNGQVTDLVLCADCARKKGLFDPQTLTFSEKFFPEEFKKRVDNIVRELTEGTDLAAGLQAEHDVLTHCPACGFTLDIFRKTGRLGCPDCYTVFARELEAALPAAADDGAEPAPADERRALEQQLRDAVAREDYERAAALRDRLRTLNPADHT